VRVFVCSATHQIKFGVFLRLFAFAFTFTLAFAFAFTFTFTFTLAFTFAFAFALAFAAVVRSAGKRHWKDCQNQQYKNKRHSFHGSDLSIFKT